MIYFSKSLYELLTVHKIDPSKDKALLFMFFIFELRFLIAPILDGLYIWRWKKRRMIVVPMSFGIAILSFCYAFKVEDIFKSKSMGLL